jgi:hypothetical protein
MYPRTLVHAVCGKFLTLLDQSHCTSVQGAQTLAGKVWEQGIITGICCLRN